jgi:pimeloyl-ACP methyl ester carboxylesterase
VADTRIMNLPDGRELAWLESGTPRGYPVFVFHGTPGSRLQVSFDERPITAAGVRFIAPDRPGYGHSSFHQGRTLADWASDVARLADHLKIEQFAVVGISGGGPHALVCADRLPDRVRALGVVSGVGPIADPAFGDPASGLNRAAMVAARAPGLLRGVLSLQEYFVRHWPDAAERLYSKIMPAADLEVMERPEVRAALRSEGRLSSAPAAAQDLALFARPWGFRLEDIAVPIVHVWHGDTDRNVPFAHGKVTAERIPGAQFHQCPGEGHLLAVTHFEEILRAVTPSN